MSAALFCIQLQQGALHEVSPSPRCPGTADHLSPPLSGQGDLGCPANRGRKAQRSISQQPVRKVSNQFQTNPKQ